MVKRMDQPRIRQGMIILISCKYFNRSLNEENSEQEIREQGDPEQEN